MREIVQVVIEYNEPHHNRTLVKQKDFERIKKIKSILNCKIIILIETKDFYKEEIIN